jgi:DNA-binding MarR family transcriptional regulator
MSRDIVDDHAELRRQLGEEVRASQSAVDALDDAAAAYLGVNRTDLRCLDVLLQLGSATPGQLAARLRLRTGSVTAMLDRLEKLGYLSRSPDPGDRRKVIVRVTPDAVREAELVYSPLAEEGERAVSRYTGAEIRLLLDFLRRGRTLQERHLDRIRALPQRRGTR